MVSMLDIDNVCVLTCHSIYILSLFVSDRHIVCHLPFFAVQLMPITLGW